MNNDTKIEYAPLVLGALVGLALVYITHPHHGERRRDRLKSNCKEFGRKCRASWLERMMAWRPRSSGVEADFQAEIRAHAPQYLQ